MTKIRKSCYNIHMFKATKTYVSLCRGENDFMFSPDGITMVPRAQVIVLEQCPANVRDTIIVALNKGWLQPIANMRDTEYTMELLRK